MNKTEYDDLKVNLIKKSLEKNKTEVYVPVERRKKDDGRLNFLNLMSIFLCGMIFAIIAVLEKACGGVQNISINNLFFWNFELLKIAFFMTLICIIVCSICIWLNFTRNKRRTDKIKKPLIICEMISLLIFIFLIFKLY